VERDSYCSGTAIILLNLSHVRTWAYFATLVSFQRPAPNAFFVTICTYPRIITLSVLLYFNVEQTISICVIYTILYINEPAETYLIDAGTPAAAVKFAFYHSGVSLGIRYKTRPAGSLLLHFSVLSGLKQKSLRFSNTIK